MSYGMHLINKKTNEPVMIPSNMEQIDSIVCLTDSDTMPAEFSVTYNYYSFFKECIGDDSIRAIYGKPLNEVLAILDKVISFMVDKYYPKFRYKTFEGTDADPGDYWSDCPVHIVTQLNCIRNVVLLCMQKPDYSDFVFTGD